VSIETKGKMEAVRAEDKRKEKTMSELVHKVYHPGRHGFAVRDNPDDPQERRCLEDSTTQVLILVQYSICDGSWYASCLEASQRQMATRILNVCFHEISSRGSM